MPALFDTHCHLDFPVFDADREQIIERCLALGVCRIVLPGVVARDWTKVMTLCRSYPQLLPSLGLHPCFLEQHRLEQDLARLAQMAGDASVCAIGEIGLDFWHGRETEVSQASLFEQQLDIAEQYNLPVLLHVRKAHDEVLRTLRRRALPAAGIVHAFSGSQQQADQYIDLGFRLGIGGSLTYARARRLAALVKVLPLTALVLETDAPDMPLSGYQGQRNQPDRLPQVLKVMAGLRQTSEAELAAQLWKNSCAVFGLAQE